MIILSILERRCLNLKVVLLPSNKPYIGESCFEYVPSLMLLIEGNQTYDNLSGFPEGSAYPAISGVSEYIAGDTINLNVTPAGSNDITIQWLHDGSIIGNGSSISIA